MRIKILFIVLSLTAFSFSQDWQPLNSGVNSNLKAVFFPDGDNGYAAGDNGVFLKTTNSGQNWSVVATPVTVRINALYFFNSATGLAAADNGIIIKTTNGGTSWRTISTGVTDNLFSISFSGSTGLCGGSSQTILRSTDSGESWVTVQTGFFGGGFYSSQMVSATAGFVGGQNSIFQPMSGKTTNGGINWNFTPFYVNGNEGELSDLYFYDDLNGLSVSGLWDGQGGISKTTDGGNTWTSMIFAHAILGIHFSGNTGFAAGLNGFICKSSDAGASWTVQNSGTQNNLYDIYVTLNSAFAAGDNGTILKTIHFVPVEFTSFSCSPEGSSIILKWETATETNNYGFEIERSFTGNFSERNWHTIGFVKGKGNSAEKQSYIFTDRLNENNMEIFYRLRQVDFNGQYSYSKEISAVHIPGNFSLSQNYPNPFNPVTVIKYSVPERSYINLVIYNMMGEKAAEVVNGMHEKGVYEKSWNATGFTSGIYFLTMQATGSESGNAYKETRKMILVK